SAHEEECRRDLLHRFALRRRMFCIQYGCSAIKLGDEMEILANRVGGEWRTEGRRLPVVNPATGQAIAEAPSSGAAEIDLAVRAAARAFPEWRRTPAGDRVQPLFKLKALLELNLDDLARTITQECGKTLAESTGEIRR